MKIQRYPDSLPPEAILIRDKVFVEEQGFREEYDEIDGRAVHFVLFCQGVPAATCRVFGGDSPEEFYLGRLAVMWEHRGQGLGTLLMHAAEDYLSTLGCQRVRLHAQTAAADFYAALGYAPVGCPDEEEGCPHIWMEKHLIPMKS